MSVTVMDCAHHRGVVEKEGRVDAGALADVGFPILGGCCRCEASIAAYNAYPSYNGYWCCSACIGDDGFDTAESFEQWCEKGDADDD
jgi:hypothetical protein